MDKIDLSKPEVRGAMKDVKPDDVGVFLKALGDLLQIGAKILTDFKK